MNVRLLIIFQNLRNRKQNDPPTKYKDDGTTQPVEDHCCFICLRDTITSTLMARVPV